MTKETLSPDRHLRYFAVKHLRNADPSIRRVLQEIKVKPKLIVERGCDFDQALLGLEFSMNFPDEFIAEQDRDKYKNLAALREELEGQELSNLSIVELSHESQTNKSPSEKIVKALTDSEDTFTAIADLIRSDEWGYLKEIDNSGAVISALLIEGYGLFLERHYEIEGLRPVFVRAFEEVLGVKYSDSPLWLEVKPWVIEERGLFSESFIESIS